MGGYPELAPLADGLEQIAAVLDRLCALAEQQRQAVADADLERLLTLTEQQEVLAARLALFEQRRADLQRALETRLGQGGLRAIAAHASDDTAERTRLQALIDRVGLGVRELRLQQERSAQLLRSASATSRRTRAHLTRLTTAELAYSALSTPSAPPTHHPSLITHHSAPT